MRQERDSQIQALESEKTANNELLRRLQALKDILEERPPNAETLHDTLFQVLAQTVPASREQENLPKSYSPNTTLSTYSDMVKLIALDITSRLDLENIEKSNFSSAITKELEDHTRRISDRQDAITQQLKAFETTAITSESCQVTSEGSNINKSHPGVAAAAGRHVPPEGTLGRGPGDSGQITALALQFAKIEPTNYQASETFIASHRQVLHNEAIQVLLSHARSLNKEGNEVLAWRHVHQALTIQWCRSLGADGVAIFFRRITTRQDARELFLTEVAAKFQQIRAAGTTDMAS